MFRLVADKPIKALDTGLGQPLDQFICRDPGHNGHSPLMNTAVAHIYHSAARSSLQCVSSTAMGVAGAPWLRNDRTRRRWYRGGNAECFRRGKRRRCSWRHVGRTHGRGCECDEGGSNHQDGADGTSECSHMVAIQQVACLQHFWRYRCPWVVTHLQFDGGGTSFWPRKGLRGKSHRLSSSRPIRRRGASRQSSSGFIPGGPSLIAS